MSQNTILEAKNVVKFFPIRAGLLSRHVGDVRAVDGVSFEVKKGETLGLVGESGCGKSTLGRSLLKLLDITSGNVSFKGENLSQLKGKKLRMVRKNLQMIFQDPYASLNPRMTTAKIISEPFRIHKIGNKKEQAQKTIALMKQVGLKTSQLDRYPHEFSGGQRQRISIARAIAVEPDVLVADEAVSALDVSIQAQILNLMKKLQKEMGLTYLFISHDLSVMAHMCDRIAIMYLGKIVELANKDDIFSNPRHPYTKALLEAVPIAGRGKRKHRKLLKGDVPSPINPPAGCHFHPRCEFAKGICQQEMPGLKSANRNDSQEVACWLLS